jgi:hypothetical protein
MCQTLGKNWHAWITESMRLGREVLRVDYWQHFGDPLYIYVYIYIHTYIYVYILYIYSILLYMITQYQTRKRQWFPAGFSVVVARRCCYPPPSFVTPSVASCAPACWVPRACGALAWQGPWRWGDPSRVAHCWGRPPKVGLEFCVGMIWIAWLLKLSTRGSHGVLG